MEKILKTGISKFIHLKVMIVLNKIKPNIQNVHRSYPDNASLYLSAEFLPFHVYLIINYLKTTQKDKLD